MRSLIQYSTIDHRYIIAVGSKVRYADTIGEAYDIRNAMEFLEKLLKILPKLA